MSEKTHQTCASGMFHLLNVREWLGHPGCWFVSQLRCVGFVPMGSSCENSDLQGGCSSWLWRLRDWEESPKCWFKCIRLEAIASRLEAIAARLEAIAVRLEDNAIGFLKLFLRFLLRVMVQVWTPELPLLASKLQLRSISCVTFSWPRVEEEYLVVTNTRLNRVHKCPQGILPPTPLLHNALDQHPSCTTLVPLFFTNTLVTQPSVGQISRSNPQLTSSSRPVSDTRVGIKRLALVHVVHLDDIGL